MPRNDNNKNMIYHIALSILRQETVTVEAQSADHASRLIERQLKDRLQDENDSLEHFVICSVEERPEPTKGT